MAKYFGGYYHPLVDQFNPDEEPERLYIPRIGIVIIHHGMVKLEFIEGGISV